MSTEKTLGALWSSQDILHHKTMGLNNVQAVISSGCSEIDVLERFKDMKLAGFIQKPYSLEMFEFFLRWSIVTVWIFG
ncbi:MAG: hypothetical protein JKY80_05685 [Mariprofundaceae bacterium]|nr:hypothetical protein [Mariprofundaceae bacterium]